MKLTHSPKIDNDIDKFIGKACKLSYILNNRIDIEVNMPINWKLHELPNILKESFIEFPESIHVYSIREDKTLMN